MSSSDYKTCASCGSFCEPGTLFCGYCGKQLGISGEDHKTILPEEGQQGRGTRILDETQPAPTIYTPEPTMPVYYPGPPSHRSPNTTKLLVVIGVLGLLLISTVSFGLGQLVKSNSQPTINTTPSSAYQSGIPGANGQPTPTVALPTPTPIATTIVPTPTATLPPTPGKGTILYQADWSNDLNGWVGSPDWKAAYGMLVDNGSGAHYWRMSITAPFIPNTSNYAIEAEIQVVTVGGCSSFGLVGRASNGQGEQMGVNFCECHCVSFWDRDDIPHFNYDPGTSWHKYRFELKETSMNFFIDNTKITTAVDNRFTDPGSVGLWCDQMAINVRSFTVYAL